MNDFTIIINTCDSYSDAWKPFFTLLKRMWPDVGKYPIVLESETKEYIDPDLILQKPNYPEIAIGKTWSWMLYYTLKSIDSEFVLIMLEDDFLEDQVNRKTFDECLSFMRENENVAGITFKPTPGDYLESKELPGFVCLPRKAKYRVNLQIGLWRRKALLELLRIHESPWMLEIWGTIRSRRTGWKFYSAMGDANLVFDYDWGNPIIRGTWNEECVHRIENKTGITIDISQRKSAPNAESIPKYVKRKRTIHDVVNLFKSLF